MTISWVGLLMLFSLRAIDLSKNVFVGERAICETLQEPCRCGW